MLCPAFPPPCLCWPLHAEDSFDLYYGLYKYNPMARTQLDRLEASFAAIRTRLNECEAAEAAAANGRPAVADKRKTAAPSVTDAPPPASACNGGAAGAADTTAAAAAAAGVAAAASADTLVDGARAGEVVGAAV